MTLLEALKAKGPRSELLRHGAAALLNATTAQNGRKDYAYTVLEVIDLIKAGDAAPLVEANERYCPTN